jgi:hypothetical protein
MWPERSSRAGANAVNPDRGPTKRARDLAADALQCRTGALKFLREYDTRVRNHVRRRSVAQASHGFHKRAIRDAHPLEWGAGCTRFRRPRAPQIGNEAAYVEIAEKHQRSNSACVA